MDRKISDKQERPLVSIMQQDIPRDTPSFSWRSLLSSVVSSSPEETPDLSSSFLPCYYLEEEGGVLYISIREYYQCQDGNLGRERRFSLASAPDFLPYQKTDREILKALFYSLTPIKKQIGGECLLYAPSHMAINSKMLGVILPLLCETERCFWGEGEKVPLRFDNGSPWKFIVKMIAEENHTFLLVPLLIRGDKELDIKKGLIFLQGDPSWLIYQNCVHAISKETSFEWLKEFSSGKVYKVPEQEVGEYLEEYYKHEAAPQLEIPKELEPTSMEPRSPLPLLRLDRGEEEISGELYFIYENHIEVKSQDRRPFLFDRKKWHTLYRDFNYEKNIQERLIKSGFRLINKIWNREIEGAATELNDFIQEGWRVEGKEGRAMRGYRSMSLQVISDIDWFDLSGEVFFENSSFPLPRMVKLFLQGERFVRLGDGSLGILPEKWLNENRFAWESGETGDETIRFQRYQSPLLDDIVKSDEKASLDEEYKKVQKTYRFLNSLEEASAPCGFAGELRPYQRKGLSWLLFLQEIQLNGCLADDMGLGKTIQALSLLQNNRGNGPSLIVVPTSLVFNWVKEASRFTPDLKVLSLTGTQRFERWDEIPRKDVIITTYGILWRDIDYLSEIPFHYVILDEAQAIKNPDSKTAQAARTLVAKHKLSLTGTPLENHIQELWSQMEFLNPGILGSRQSFIQKFTVPRDESIPSKPIKLLKRFISPFFLRRTKEEVVPELPEKVEDVIYCEMVPYQRKLYDSMKTHYRTEILQSIDDKGIEQSQTKIFEGLLRLRQVCCHPALVGGEKNEESGKLSSLLERLDVVVGENHKALVFSQFTSFLSILREQVEAMGIEYEYLDGSTKNREERIKRFEEDDSCRLFLISLKAGGLGLNLTAAEYVFLYDPWWNPAVERQAIDRTHRIGQTKKVFAYRLITIESIEEQIQDLQTRKGILFNSLMEENEGFRKLTRRDIELLFG